MTTTANSNGEAGRDLDVLYQARLASEVARLREQFRNEVEEFKRSFPPPSDEQIERLLYPELSEFTVELGGRRFVLRELPALVERKFLRLVEQRLPGLVGEILSFDERLGDNAAEAFARVFAQASSAMDLIAVACVLVLDPAGDAGLTRAFIEAHASTARQLRILQAQLRLNGARDFLSRLFPVLSPPLADEAPAETGDTATPGSPPPSVGSSSFANLQA